MNGLHLFADGTNLSLEKHVLFFEGRPIGVLLPSCLLGLRNDELFLLGKNGLVRIPRDSAPDLIATLLASGAILLGSPDDVLLVSSLLQDPVTSRTASFVMCVCTDCAGVTNFFNKLSVSRVSILGCGGIGSMTAVLLAAACIGEIHLIDGDEVEASNLNRQLFFTPQDCGKPKVRVLKDLLMSRFPRTRVTSDNTFITPCRIKDSMSGADAVVVTLDDPIGIARLAAAEAAKMGVFYFESGYLFDQCFLRFGSSMDTADEPFREICWTRSSWSIMPSYGPINARLAGELANAILLRVGGITNAHSHRLTSWIATDV